MTRDRKLVLAGIVAMPWVFFWIIFLDLLRPRYNYLHRAVSELGALGAPHGLWMDVCGFGITGLLLLAFTLGFRGILKERAHGWIFLLVTALLFIGTATPLTRTLGAIPNPDYSAISTRIHLFFAVSAPVAWIFGLFFIICRSAPKPLKWLSVGVLTGTGGLFLAAALGAFPGSPGLVQRIMFGLFFSWYVLAAVCLLWMPERYTQQVAAVDLHPATRATGG